MYRPVGGSTGHHADSGPIGPVREEHRLRLMFAFPRGERRYHHQPTDSPDVGSVRTSRARPRDPHTPPKAEDPPIENIDEEEEQ